MSHHIYHTEGLVLSGANFGEANRFISIFTKDLGMIQGIAQGVREVRSKLKYSLQDFSYSKISLVRGKKAWRITNAAPHKNFYQLLQAKETSLVVCARVVLLIKKLVNGEDKNEALFFTLVSFLEFIERAELVFIDLCNAEYIVALRILNSLGYLGGEAYVKEFVTSVDWNRELLSKMDLVKKKVILDINNALKESQLVA